MFDRILFPVAVVGLIYLALKSGSAQAADRPPFNPYIEVETTGAGMSDEVYRQYLIANGYDPELYGYAPLSTPDIVSAAPGFDGESNLVSEPEDSDRGSEPAPAGGKNVIRFPGSPGTSARQYTDDAANALPFPSDQQNQGAGMNADQNVASFLRTIRYAEGTAGPDGYRTLFGGEFFDSFADHPRKVITRKLGASVISSSAAGAYQILEKTWDDLQATMQLPDFSPDSQDAAALFLITRRGALADIRAGNFTSAIAKLNREWASLPGSPYGQPTKSMDKLASFYTGQGGEIAA